MVRGRLALRDFPGYAKIRRLGLLLEPWTVDNGLLTPTLKVKRAKVLEKMQAENDVELVRLVLTGKSSA